MPLKLSIEQRGDTFLTLSDTSSSKDFKLVCNTNILKTIEHQITWLKDDREVVLDERISFYATSILNDTSHANSVLVFKSIANRNLTSYYNGAYSCKLHVRYPDAGQGTFYLSEAKKVKFDFYGNFLDRMFDAQIDQKASYLVIRCIQLKIALQNLKCFFT